MNVEDVFKNFISHEREIKVIYVASVGVRARVNCAPKLIAGFREPLTIYMLDYPYTMTHANITEHPQVSVSFMSDEIFTGYRLNGVCEILREGEEFEKARELWMKRLIAYEADRIYQRIKGLSSTREAENKVPEEFVILKFRAQSGSVVKPDRVCRTRMMPRRK